MSAEYDALLERHRVNVKNGYSWIKKYMPEVLLPGYDYDWYINAHDLSKRNKDEYYAFDAFIFGDRSDVEKREKYRRAQLYHRHRNPHHWEFWILHTSNTKQMALDMDYPYIIEMICDWWSFSWESGDLFDIFDWYRDHKKNIIMSKQTKKTLEDILDKLEEKLIKVRGPRN